MTKGLPKADFIEDVSEFMKTRPAGTTAEQVISELDAQHAMYKRITNALMGKKKRLLEQIPELKTTLGILGHVMEQSEAGEKTDAEFLLADNLFAKAKIEPTDKVCLWLGANVMLEYGAPEAKELLSGNLRQAQENLSGVQEELDMLRDQQTTTEVNMARVYNYDVTKRREEAIAGPGGKK